GGRLLLSHDAFVRAFTVPGGNGAPDAVDDSRTTAEDTSVTVAVLANDTDPDGDALAVTAVGSPAHGAAVLNADGTVTYTPAADFNGGDTFTFKVNDGTVDSNVAQVFITVNPVQDPPVAVAGPDQTAGEAAPVAFDGRGSYDVDGDSLTYAWTFGDGGTAAG